MTRTSTTHNGTPSWLEPLTIEANRDAAVITLAESFMRASDEDRKTAAAGWDYGAEWPYPATSRLSCHTGERSSPRERILASLVLDVLGRVLGSRESIIGLAMVFRSCELAGLDPFDVFASVAAASPPDQAEALATFAAREPEDRAMSEFFVKEVTNADGETELIFKWGN